MRALIGYFEEQQRKAPGCWTKYFDANAAPDLILGVASLLNEEQFAQLAPIDKQKIEHIWEKTCRKASFQRIVSATGGFSLFSAITKFEKLVKGGSKTSMQLREEFVEVCLSNVETFMALPHLSHLAELTKRREAVSIINRMLTDAKAVIPRPVLEVAARWLGRAIRVYHYNMCEPCEEYKPDADKRRRPIMLSLEKRGQYNLLLH